MSTSSSDAPVIRQRNVTSRRRRDGLIQYAKDVTSQNGEDGIIERLFQLLPFASHGEESSTRFCVDVGAWDGVHLSNTHSLLVTSSSSSSLLSNSDGDESNIAKQKEKWQGVLIEADHERFQQLKELQEPLGNTCMNVAVSCIENDRSLVTLLRKAGAPRNIDFLCIDVDGSDYWLLHDILDCNHEFEPNVICVEFNPTMPDDLIYIPSRSDVVRHGASLSALYELAVDKYNYVLVETTLYNAFFVRRDLYEQYLRNDVKATTIEELHETTMGTSLYQLYDGTIKLHGCKKLLWHRMAIDEKKIQVLKPEQRNFPFAPPPLTTENDNALRESAVDMKSYCSRNENHNNSTTIDEDKQVCAAALMEQLKAHGFALVRGTGISSQQCRDAIHATRSFLQDADESVRRSCLAKDRARRGYSPMCTENFASLIGQEGPNDLVRKFRVGPSSELEGATNSSSSLTLSSLHQPNAWPSDEAWNTHDASSFRSSVEAYYEKSCAASHAIVKAICDGIAAEQPDLADFIKILSMKDSVDHTSILTLLGYRIGTRHRRKQKEPLVAPHTDVGVITMLLFDSGDCATLQRADTAPAATVNISDASKGKNSNPKSWVDVSLPSVVSDDPVFVVNIGDCLSELTNGALPSTLHQVVPLKGTVPRNCLALFVGLDSNERLSLPNGEQMTYEEWRKRRIGRAQDVLRLHGEKENKKK